MTSFVQPLSMLPGFDPKKIPVIAKDDHLPAAPASLLSADALRQRFANPPQWQPEVRRELKLTDRKPALAAVLLGLVMRDQPSILLTQRTAHLSTHSGQIAFPGGKTDETDASAVHTALREAQEEIGLDSGHVEILGTLPEYVTVTSFIITPVVGLVSPDHQILANPDEVDLVFEVPLSFLMNPANHHRHEFVNEAGRREWFSMPYQDQDTQHFIWGATAGMLRNFYRFLMA
jgi:8-oxo-dGTP pyrophosphatase MutT (NUDIX family)